MAKVMDSVYLIIVLHNAVDARIEIHGKVPTSTRIWPSHRTPLAII